MANAFYAQGIDAFLAGSIAYSSDTIKVDLVSSASYTPNLSTDQYHSTVTSSGGIIAAGVALASKTHSGGTASAANTVWTAVTGGAAAYIVIWKDTGTDSTSPLIGLIDTATGLPVTPNGGDITAAWSSGQIFTLKVGVKDADRAKVQRWLNARWEQVCDWVRAPGGLVWTPQTQRIVVPAFAL